MFKLDIVFTGLVFFAQAPTDAKFTNAVLVTGTEEEVHRTRFAITKGSVTVMQGANLSQKRSWDLGPDAMVFVEATAGAPPKRTGNFDTHVPSVGRALAETSLAGKPAAACTYAADLPSVCAFQNGRIRMSGGTLDAVTPSPDPEYPFLTTEFAGRHWSRIASTTKWQGSVHKILIKEGGLIYEVTATSDVEIEAGSHPKKEGAHFRVLRHLYGASDADFPEPRDIYEFFRLLGKSFPSDAKANARILTEARPIMCPPATQ